MRFPSLVLPVCLRILEGGRPAGGGKEGCVHSEPASGAEGALGQPRVARLRHRRRDETKEGMGGSRGEAFHCPVVGAAVWPALLAGEEEGRAGLHHNEAAASPALRPAVAARRSPGWRAPPLVFLPRAGCAGRSRMLSASCLLLGVWGAD